MNRLVANGFLALLPLAGTAAAQELEVPSNDGWVTDLAGLLTPAQEQALEESLEAYKQGSGHEVAVLTVPTLNGAPIERFALQVARDWKIGREGSDDGVLLVISKAERKLRIEVLRGLEGDIPDSVAGRIIRDVISPRFKQDRYYDGVREGVEAICAAAGGDYAPLERASRRSPPAAALAGLIPLLFFLFVFMALARSGRRARTTGGGSALPWILMGSMLGGGGRRGGGGFGGGGFSGFGGGGGARGGGASGGW